MWLVNRLSTLLCLLPPSLPPSLSPLHNQGGDALVGSGVMESLIQVLEWKAFEPSNITVSYVLTGSGFLYIQYDVRA